MRAVAHRYVVMPKEQQPGASVPTIAGEHREGGASTVVKAIDTQNGHVVAVKLIPRADTDDTHRVFFQREVAALGRLTHPNIVSLLDHGEDEAEDTFYLVFPWVEKRLREVLPPPEQDFGWDDFANTFGLPLLNALAYAHERDVVHRDVKPGNILISEDQTPLLADFGISKIRSHLTEATVAEFVSRPYSPPELDGMGSASRDLWGFAATAVGCLTGLTLTDYPHLDAAFDELDVPREVEALLRQCTSRDPAARPRDAMALRNRLQEIQTRRNRKWLQPRLAQLDFKDHAVRRLVAPPHDRDPEVVERALQAEIARGTHLLRVTDRATGMPMPDTLDLVGERARLRLVSLPEQPTFVVNRVNDDSEAALDAMRNRGWRVADEITWTSKRQPPAEARQTRDMVLAALDEHYLRLNDEQRQRDENRMFDKWMSLLDAKEELERTRTGALRYTSTEVRGKRVRFQLATAPDVDVLGEERVCRVATTDGSGRDRIVGGAGVVIAQDEDVLTLGYQREPRNLPTAGELVLDIGPARAALARQRDAVVSVRSGIAVRPLLRELLLDPTRIGEQAIPVTTEWFDTRLDSDKQTALGRALGSKDFFLLEGPPGTGKTRFITELVRQELHRNPAARILLVSQTHVAVDNALVRLAEEGLENLVRLGRSGDERIAAQARRHLLEERMPAWVQEIRARADSHLRKQAAEKQVELTHLQGAAALLECIAALEDQATAEARLRALGGTPARGKKRASTRPAPEAEVVSPDEEAILSEIVALTKLVEQTAERVQNRRAHATDLLGAARLDTLMPAGQKLSVEAARAAFEAVIGEDSGLEKLVGILRLQAEWLQRLESSQDLEAVLLQRARVVAGTCLGFLSHPAVRELEFDLCILDEASKATATETLVPLSRSRRWVLVGDPNQLPPMQEEVLDSPALMQRHNLQHAEVERSLFRELLDLAPELARHQLTHQYRMHPGIGDLVSACFYQGVLQSVANPELPGWERLYKPVTWLDTARSERRRETLSGTSVFNHHEVKVIKKALAELRTALTEGTVRTANGGPLQVLVLTGYRKQMEELRRAVAGPASPLLEIEVNTIDAVQGRESDVTFYSVVRSNTQNRLGFLGPAHWRRINVALSRARHGLVIVGDVPFCEIHPGPLRDVVTHMRKHPDTCRIRTAQA
ncbi:MULTISPECIES: bifunctional serine/threonine-protein kinase/DEAD/DEAH box helicase [unclassified Crossiella]|uniref:bifunctional serine/threonine-protein kinase/DEAD/DEAH box helicase n=1 Tax=unclassified Crossiella TaxID=2620835 RepID=UPI001FFE5832|nr:MULTISPECIES: bifunctional serine/threonine-protein kinase/DEAD/DEAH box helicase [unclassified Crossiella]MCK2240985.1 AAA domain-containing protein [Crossiella sp. S99.2]MCK2253871.1 AAA domain-containing protein [Crossiella sp. S99.1]